VLACCLASAGAQQISLPEDALSREGSYFKQKLKAPYMAQNCAETSYPGWEGLPLQKCRYTVQDEGGVQKSATVILLIPSVEQIARWVVYACMEVKGNADRQCTDTVSRRIVSQSGGQFPVAGVVLEDILPTDNPDGIYEVYVFRDGVTVRVDGIKNGSTIQPTEEQLDAALFGEVKSSGIYARVQGTTREEYKVYGGTVDVGESRLGHRKLAWLQVVRELFKSAWNSNRK